jgi:DivIVA domain-containing protein
MTDLIRYGIKLTANAIHAKQFKKKVRGYDADEVDEYLDEIIKDYARMEELFAKFESDLATAKREAMKETVRQKEPERAEEPLDAFSIKRRLEDLEYKVFGEKRDRMRRE